MATNFIAAGKLLPFTAPVGGVVCGEPYLIGSLVVIAQEDAAEAALFMGACTEVWRVPRVDSEEWAEGDKVYFDANFTPPSFTNVADSLPCVGIALENIDASPPVATGLVRLDGAVR